MVTAAESGSVRYNAEWYVKELPGVLLSSFLQGGGTRDNAWRLRESLESVMHKEGLAGDIGEEHLGPGYYDLGRTVIERLHGQVFATRDELLSAVEATVLLLEAERS